MDGRTTRHPKNIQGAQKSNPLGKIRLNCSNFFAKFTVFTEEATYPANFIAIFGCIQKL